MFKWKDIVISVLLILCICCSVTAALKTGVVVGPQGEQGLQGEQGEQGIQGIKGEQGEKGDKGDAGIAGQNGRDGVDGINGKDGIDGINGKDGIDGKDGVDGKDGKDGLTPYIGPDGNWYIGDENTGISATTLVYETVVTTDWSNCKKGDTIAFTFCPYYVASRDSGFYIYDYQGDAFGNHYIIYINSYTIGDTTYTPPANGASDKHVHNSNVTYACIGTVISKSDVGDGSYIKIELLNSIRT